MYDAVFCLFCLYKKAVNLKYDAVIYINFFNFCFFFSKNLVSFSSFSRFQRNFRYIEHYYQKKINY